MLHNKFRPKSFDDVIGNDVTKSALKALLSREKGRPHSFLLYGSKGTGKTTIARIIANSVACHDYDLTEMNFSNTRGIDTSRELIEVADYVPRYGKSRVWIFDECFQVGTLIKTPDGNIPIEQISVGQEIINLEGRSKVTNLFKNKVKIDRIAKVTLSNNQEIICTKDHLFLTKNGWVPAYKLQEKKDLLLSLDSCIMSNIAQQKEDKNAKELCLLRKTTFPRTIKDKNKEVLLSGLSEVRQESKNDTDCLCHLQKNDHPSCTYPPTNLRNSMRKQTGGIEKDRKEDTRRSQTTNERGDKEYVPGSKEKTFRKTFRTDEKEQSNEFKSVPRESLDNQKVERDISQCTHKKRGEWNRITSTTEDDCISFGVADRIYNKNSVCYDTRSSQSLQDRYCQSNTQSSNRDRWGLSQYEVGQIKRREEEYSITEIGVESIEIYQQGNNDRHFLSIISDQERIEEYTYFYDLEVEGHPSYHANNVLVHNCHKATNDAQNCLLKLLEEPPKHGYYILCTTEPTKVIATIRDRCYSFQTELLSEDRLLELIDRVLKAEGKELPEKIKEHIASKADGSARSCLVMLDKIIDVPKSDLSDISNIIDEEESEIKQLCQYFLKKNKLQWKGIASILKKINREPETIRHAILAYMNVVLLNSENPQAALIIDCFKDPFYNSGKAGLTLACYEVLAGLE